MIWYYLKCEIQAVAFGLILKLYSIRKKKIKQTFVLFGSSCFQNILKILKLTRFYWETGIVNDFYCSQSGQIVILFLHGIWWRHFNLFNNTSWSTNLPFARENSKVKKQLGTSQYVFSFISKEL